MPLIVYLTSTSPGIVMAGGSMIGVIEDKPLTVKSEPGTVSYLQFFPYGAGRAPVTVCLRFEEDIPQAVGGLIRLWPKGRVELRFEADQGEDAFGGADFKQLQARNLLTFVRDNQRNSALMTISKNLSDALDYEILRSFIGGFDGVEEARFVSKGSNETVLAVFTQTGPIKRMRLFGFSFDEENGEALIDDIRSFA